MQYLVLIYEDETRFAKGFSESEFAEYGAFGKKNAAAIKAGQALQPTATAKTVRVRDSKILTTDGPFAEDQRAAWRLLPARSGEHRRSGLDGSGHTSRPLRMRRSTANHGLFLA